VPWWLFWVETSAWADWAVRIPLVSGIVFFASRQIFNATVEVGIFERNVAGEVSFLAS